MHEEMKGKGYVGEYSISDIIKDLGDKFMGLDNMNGIWRAVGEGFDDGTGTTPEEALGNLWLFIHNEIKI